jgi:menaquinone-specific isochorismate synthase
MEPAGSEGVTAASLPSGDGRLVSRSCEMPELSFRAFLASGPTPRVAWATPGGLEAVGTGAAAELTAAGEGRFERLRAGASALFDGANHDGPRAARPRAFGGLAFDPDHEPGPPWTGFPAAAFVVPRLQLTRADGATWLTVHRYGEDPDVASELAAARESVAELPAMQPTARPPGVERTRPIPGRSAWTEQVRTAAERIRRGELRKVVLATALEAELAADLDVPGVLERFRRSYPDCYRFLVQPGEDAAFFGPPPERLVRLDGRTVRTEALAGSVRRGDTPEEDADLAAQLRDSEKIRHEQRLVVEAIRDQLSPLGDCEVGERTVRELATIQHLQTPITAELDANRHVLDLVEALHPTPAVGGLPPTAALATIRQAESFDRGWYAAPVGWFDRSGDGEFAVAIRSAVGAGPRATLFAGNGIVGDSDPEEEWAEIQPKYRPVLDELELRSGTGTGGPDPADRPGRDRER